MPKISQAFQAVKVSLPSYPDSEVEIKTNIPVSDVLEAEKIESNIERAVLLASNLIIRWNFQDEEGKELPINKDILLKFPANDLVFLLETITPYLQKKTESGKTS